MEIKPCPKCKSTDIGVYWFAENRVSSKQFCECNECHFSGPARSGERRAIKAWNKEQR